MKSQRPVVTDDEHRVLKFRPRTMAQPPGQKGEPSDIRQEANDLSRYERNREEPDDFRHRMLANMAAFSFPVAVIPILIWLALRHLHLPNSHDFLLLDRRESDR